MTDRQSAWPRDTMYVHVTPDHVARNNVRSLTESAAALAVADAIGPGTAVVSVDTDLVTAHEKAAPFRHWHAETPEEVAEWLADLDAFGDEHGSVAEAARMGLLDFTLEWREGNPVEAAVTAGEGEDH